MPKINLLKSLPKPKRKINGRKQEKNKKIIDISRRYGKLYFDGDRKYGYGGYYYDGRWKKVARDIIKKYKLKKGAKVLDVGCAKGFLVKDLVDLGIDAYGLDISDYALKNAPIEIQGRVHLGDAKNLQFPDNSFDLVLSINTAHNLIKKDCIKSILELKRVSKKNCFLQVDAYRNIKEKKIFENWVLTAKFHDYTYNWEKIFKRIGYKGDYYWTIIS